MRNFGRSLRERDSLLDDWHDSNVDDSLLIYKSKFPCTYEQCTCGFMDHYAFENHKEEERNYCRVCDEDYINWDSLLEHKMNNGNHIRCGICGDVPYLWWRLGPRHASDDDNALSIAIPTDQVQGYLYNDKVSPKGDKMAPYHDAKAFADTVRHCNDGDKLLEHTKRRNTTIAVMKMKTMKIRTVCLSTRWGLWRWG